MKTLPTTYFGPVSWYAQLARAEEPVFIDSTENYTKQTTRSRCRIATANGVQTLSVPVNTSAGRNIRDILVTEHANWRRVHWNALCSAYGESPFFEYYADDIRPFFEAPAPYELPRLYDFNLEITRKMCDLIGITPEIVTDSSTLPSPTPPPSIFNHHAASPLPEDTAVAPYYQVFRSRHGFLPDLSILDLLFNMGNESLLYLSGKC